LKVTGGEVTLRPSQVEKQYGIKRGTLMNMGKRGLPLIKINAREGRRGIVLVRVSALDAYLAENEVVEKTAATEG
jgi:hypothetical protein